MRTISKRRAADPFTEPPGGRPESEKAALAAMLISLDADPAAVGQAAIGLEPAMFSDAVHGEIMQAIKTALQSERPGIAEVAAAIRRQSLPAGDDPAVATAVVAELVEMFVGADPVRTAQLAGQEIREAHAIRAADLTLAHGLRRIRSGQPTAADLTEIGQELARAQELIAPPSKSQASGLLAVLEHWAKADIEPVVRTMFGPLDRRLGGGLAIGLTGIAAKPGVGKSALACQLTLGSLLADRQARAVWFRGEMTNDLLAGKMVAAWSALRGDAVDAATFKDARCRRKSARAVAVDMANTLGDRLVIVDPPLTPDRIEQEIARVRPQLAVVDYLQLCEAGGRQDRRGEIEHVTRNLARMATKYGVAVVVVSAIASTKNEATGIGALAKDSNLLDYDVHTFLTLWADDKDKADDPREIRMKIEKSRTGVPGDVALYFSGSAQFFTPADAELADDPTFYAEFADFDQGAPG